MPQSPGDSAPRGSGDQSPATFSPARLTPGQDSTPAVLAQQAAVLRVLPPATRLRLAVEMSDAARGLLRARLAAMHPDWDVARLRVEECRLLYALPVGAS